MITLGHYITEMTSLNSILNDFTMCRQPKHDVDEIVEFCLNFENVAAKKILLIKLSLIFMIESYTDFT